MILADNEISELINKGVLGIDPLLEGCLQPASVDLTLGNEFSYLDDKEISEITLGENPKYKTITRDIFVLQPKTFVLATTQQYLKLPNDLTAFVEGRSSIGRLGLFIENAGWVDPGFEGELTLELFNATNLPIKLDKGRRICQLVFCKMGTAPSKPYKGKYQGQKGATGSKISQDQECLT